MDDKSELLEAMANLQPLHIYGSVVDQYGQPVEGAKVRVSWTEVRIPPDPGQSKWIETDKSGNWEITIDKPGRASVRDIEKDGYQFDRKTSPYFAAPNREALIRQTTKQNPLVLTMRKKGDSTFLVHNKGRVDFVPPGGVQRIDLLEKRAFRVTDMEGEVDVSPWDVQIKATFSEEEQQWKFAMATSDQDGVGILVTEGALYEAPLDGYGAEHHESMSLDEDGKSLTLFIKSRTPSIYSRLTIRFNLGKERCILSYESWVNPYGSRNLEYDTELQEEWKLRKQLETDAKLRIKQGKRPEKPDLKALIQAEKEKKQQR